MAKVKLKRAWFSPAGRRYRAYPRAGVVDIPDHLLKHLPTDAEIIGEAEAKVEADKAEEAKIRKPVALSELLPKTSHEKDASAALKKALSGAAGHDPEGAAHAAHSAASKQPPRKASTKRGRGRGRK